MIGINTNPKSYFDVNLKNILLIISSIALFFTFAKLVFMLVNIIHFSVVNSSYNEIRDYVSFRLTNFIMNGINPYTVEALTKTTVPFMLLYTGLQPLLVAFICKITGLSILAGNYTINILLFILTSLNVWLIVKNFFPKHKWIVILCAFINTATFFSLIGLPILNFHTDLVGIYIVSLMHLIIYKWKEHTFLLSLMSVILIFTKQILIVLVIPMFLYYCLVNKKLAIKYFLQCSICGIFTLLIVQKMFPLYWTETIYAQFCESKNYGSFFYSILNICHFYYRYLMYVLLIMIPLICTLSYKRYSLLSIMQINQYAIYLALNIVIGTISLLYFAKCGGDGYKYCQDILAPSLFILGVRTCSWYFNNHKSVTENEVMYVVLLLLLSLSSVITYERFNFVRYTKSDEEAYKGLNEIIALHHNEHMYLGMGSSQYMLSKGIFEDEKIYFNDGQIQYFITIPDDNKLTHNLFYGETLKKVAEHYVDTVNSMVKKQEFGIITTCLDKIIDQTILKEHYYLYDNFSIKYEANVHFKVFEVSVWLPKRVPSINKLNS